MRANCIWTQMSMLSNPKQKFHLSDLLVDFYEIILFIKKGIGDKLLLFFSPPPPLFLLNTARFHFLDI